MLLADDMEIYGSAESNNSYQLQSDINKLMSWCTENRLFFNNKKCAIITLSRSSSQIIITHYTMDDHAIERKDEIRDLGVLIDRQLHFGHHIEQKTTQARRMIGCIKHFFYGNFTYNTQKILYSHEP